MQHATIQFQPPSLSLRPTKQPIMGSLCRKLVPPLQTPRLRAVPIDTSMVDYSSMTNSVFPAEACETLGGEACNVEMMYPEVKLQKRQLVEKDDPPSPSSSETTVEREYYEYSNSSKTVFVEEACDDLGGEFCNPDYQKGDK